MRRTDVCTVDCFRRGLEAKTNILVPPLLLGGDLLATCESSLHEHPAADQGWIALCARTYRGPSRFGRCAASGMPSRSDSITVSTRRPSRRTRRAHLFGHGWGLEDEGGGVRRIGYLLKFLVQRALRSVGRPSHTSMNCTVRDFPIRRASLPCVQIGHLGARNR